MNHLKIRKLLSIALFGALGIFGIPYAELVAQRKVAVIHHGVINPIYSPPIIASLVSNPINRSLENVLAKTAVQLQNHNIGIKKKVPLHVSFFYLTQLPSRQELTIIEDIVQEAMRALKNEDISFTVVPQLDLMGKADAFIVVRLQPSQGAINFFNYVRTELIKAGIAHINYPKFEAHISLAKITTPGITRQQLADIMQQGADDLKRIPVAQLSFTVSSCMLVQNLAKPPVVSFEFQQAAKSVAPVVVPNVANVKPAAAVAKAVQKVAPRAVAPQVKVAAKKAVAKQQPKVQPKAVQKVAAKKVVQPKAAQKVVAKKVAPRVVAPKAKVVAKNAPKRPVVKQQPKVQPKKVVQKVQPKKAVQKIAPRAVAPKAKVVAKNAPKRPVAKQQPKVVKKP